MINIQTIKLTKTKELIFAVTFTALSVYTPVIFHYFGGADAGRSFLPMHFFILVAGLLLGWRAGLITGLASPVISYFLSGMPMFNLLPFIAVELSCYGLVVGILRQKFNLNIFVSLIGALIIGRIFLILFLFLFSDMNALNYMKSALIAGWQGIVLQILFIPFIVLWIRDYFKNI